MHHSVYKSTSRFIFPEGLLKKKSFLFFFFAFIHHKYILQQNINFIALFSIELHFHTLVGITYK